MQVYRQGGVVEVRDVVAACMPHYLIESVALAGEGLDSVAYEVNGELIVRFSREPDPARLDREIRLLAAVAAVAPLPVPEPLFAVAELGCMAYAKLPGTPLLDLPELYRSGRGTTIAATLREFLAVLHAAPVARMAGLVDVDYHPLSQWRREAAGVYSTVAGRIPPVYRRRIEAFLAAAPPDGAYVPVFSHNDLGIEHVLVDPATGAVTGIIDWSDAAITDPAHDFGLLYRDLGVLAGSHQDRAVFYARCGALEDLAYGIQTGRGRYLDKSLAALEWLWP